MTTNRWAEIPGSEATRREVYELSEVCLRGEATGRQRGRLEELVCGDLAARRFYCEFIGEAYQLAVWAAGRGAADSEVATDVDSLELDRALLADLQPAQKAAISTLPVAVAGAVEPVDCHRDGVRGWMTTAGDLLTRPFGFSIALAALTLAFAVLAMTLIRLSTDLPHSNETVASGGDAQHAAAPIGYLVAASEDVVWQPGSDAAKVGTALREGQELRIVAGALNVAFDSGARAVVYAPADLQLLGRNAARLRRGRLAADVPPSGRGFTVDTPAARVVDQGTEFSLAVDEGNASLVRVFVGAVDVSWRPGGQAGERQLRRLKAGEAVKISFTGSTSEPAADEGEFARVDQFDSLRHGLLFADRFACAGQRDVNPEGISAAIRGQSGTMTTGRGVRYSISGDASVAERGERDRDGQDMLGVLRIGPGARISPDVNFNRQQIVRAGGLAVEFDFDVSVHDDDDLFRWVGVRLSCNDQTRLARFMQHSGPHLHLRSGGRYAFYDGQSRRTPAGLRPRFAEIEPGWQHIRVELHVASFDDAPARLRAFANGNREPFVDDVVAGHEENFITLEYESGIPESPGVALIDNLRVMLLGHPRTIDENAAP